MTGDTDRRKRIVAATLSVIMALSMVAMGVAFFAGSAAASPADDGDFEGFVAANEAGTDSNGVDHVITLNVTAETDVAGLTVGDDNDDEIEITYTAAEDIDVDETFEDSQVEIDVINEEGTTVDNIDSGDEVWSFGGDDDNTLTIDFDDSGPSTALDENDLLRITIQSGTGNINHQEATDGLDVDVDVTDGETTESFPTQDLALPGPIEYYDDDPAGDVDEYYYSLFEALDATTQDDSVNVTDLANFDGELSELLTQTEPLDGDTNGLEGNVDVSNDDVIVDQEVADQTIYWSDSGDDQLVQLTRNDIEVDGLELSGETFLDDVAPTALNPTGDNVEIADGSYEDFSDTAIDAGAVEGLQVDNNVIVGDDDSFTGVNVDDTAGDTGDVDISNNDISGVDDGVGIEIDDMSENDLLNITDNEVNDVDEGVGISANPSDDDATLTIDETNDIDIEGSAAAGVLIDTSGDSPTVQINDTIVSADDDANDDRGIAIEADGDISAVDYEVVIAGDDTDVSDANTAIDVDFSGATDGGNHEVDIIEGVELTIDGDTTDPKGVDANYDVDALDSLTLTVSDLTVTGDEDTVGVDASSNADSLEVFLDTGVDDGSTFDGADVGVSVDNVDDLGDISNTTFENVETAALEIDATDGTDLDLEDITVEDSAGATAVEFDDDANLRVLDSMFGTEDAQERPETGVGTGVNVESGGTSVDVNSTVIYLDGADDDVGIQLDGSLDDSVISETEIDGFAGEANETAIDTGSGTIDSDGIVVTNVNIANIDTGVHIDDGDTVDIEDSFTASVGTAVHVNDDGSDVTIETTEFINIADDGVGVLGESVGDLDIKISEFEAVTDDATAIEINDDGTINIKHNDIVDFDGDNSYGLAGDSLGDVDDATGNWWGDEFGPQSDDGSNVDVAADGQEADLYDPFLTANQSTLVDETSAFDGLEDIEDDEITLFGHDLVADDGDAIAFPGTSENTIDEAHVEFDGMILAWDQDEQEWNQVTDERPEGLDAYQLVYENPGDDATNVLVEYASETDQTVNRGDYEYSQSWNFVPSAKDDDLDETAAIESVDTFNFETTDEGSIAAVSGGDYQIYAADSFANTEMNDHENDEEVSPFQGYWVYAYGETVDERNGAPIDPSVKLGEVDDQLTAD